MTSRIVDDDVGMWLSAVFVQMCMLKAKRSYTIITHDASLTSITAAPPPPCGAILFRLISERTAELTYLTEALEDGLAYDGTSPVPPNHTAYASWGSGEWVWMVVGAKGGLMSFPIGTDGRVGDGRESKFDESRSLMSIDCVAIIS